MALLDLTAELTGTLPGLSPILAQRYINRALTQIYNVRNWSFLLTDGVLVCPALVDDGTVALTQYSADITLDADASAALLAQTLVGAVPGILNLQIRFGSSSPATGSIYSIVDYNVTNPAAIILTLDRVVVEATDAASGYQCYRCYVVPPIDDFLRWESLVDPANAITFQRNRLTVTSADFDRMDPQRSSQGLAYWLGAWGSNRIVDAVTGATAPNSPSAQGTPIYELWPHPTSGQTFYCRFRRAGAALVNATDEQPPIITDALILAKALYAHAYPFAMANVGNFPTMKGARWTELIAFQRAEYQRELLTVKRTDMEQQLQSSDVWNRGYGLRSSRPFGRYGDLGYPIDSAYLQSHLVRF
jgi:hypothetical protein